MHDTASRWLFTEGSRNFSHGCIRLQNPLDFAEKVFGGRSGFSKERVRQVIDAGQQAHYTFPEPVTLYVTYRTVTAGSRRRRRLPRRHLRPRQAGRARNGQAEKLSWSSSAEEAMEDVPVLIVGGGPVGLTASILLSQAGVRSLLVERHPGTAIHPKARGINARSMEMYRQCGVEAAIRKAGLPPERAGFIVWARTLAGEEIERRVPWRSGPQSTAVSPVRNCLCAQDDLEPVLRAFAERPGRRRAPLQHRGHGLRAGR